MLVTATFIASLLTDTILFGTFPSPIPTTVFVLGVCYTPTHFVWITSLLEVVSDPRLSVSIPSIDNGITATILTQARRLLGAREECHDARQLFG